MVAGWGIKGKSGQSSYTYFTLSRHVCDLALLKYSLVRAVECLENLNLTESAHQNPIKRCYSKSELKKQSNERKKFMRTFSFFSNTFLIISCYPNSCTLVVLGSFRFYKEKKGNEGTTLLRPLTTWRSHTTLRRFVRDINIRNIFVERFTLYENEH